MPEPEPQPQLKTDPQLSRSSQPPMEEPEPMTLDADDVVELDDDDVLLEDAEPSAATAVPMEIEEVESLDSSVIEVEDDAVEGEIDPDSEPSMTQTVLSEAADSDGMLLDTESLTDFDKILFEARVYIKYRLFEHALDHVSTALSQQPQHVGALSLLARAYTELGRTVEAADAHARVARLVIDSDPKLAREHISAALGLAPGHVEALQVEEMMQRVDGPADEVSIEAPLSPEPAPEVARTELLHVDSSGDPSANLLDIHHGPDGVEEEDFAIEVDLDSDGDADEVPGDPIEIEDRFGLDSSDDDNLVVYDGATATSQLTVDGRDPFEQPETELLGEDAGAFDELAAEVSEHGERDLGGSIDLLEPNVDTGVLQLEEHAEQRGKLHPDAPEPDTAEPDLVGLSIGKDEAKALEPDVDLDGAADYPDISDDVAEIRFYRDQGLDDDAEAALEDLRKRYPGHPALADFGEPEAPQAAPVPVEHGASSPLVSLDEDEDEDAYLSAIFSDPAPAAPKKPATTGARVASQDVDAQSAFDLGVAYREMGLVDQAVSQFESAASDPGLKVRALVMLGTLRLQQGDAPGAVSSLEQAVQGATNDDERAEANYELGVVYEKIGETSKAIASLSAVSAGYRDRDERLGQLQG